jgi:hypothetical protein
MFKLPQTLTYGAALLAAGVLTLTVPRAAHAIAATLVQVTNTATAPAIAQDVSKLASQQVMLYSPGILRTSTTEQLAQVAVNGFPLSQSYSVPAGQTLIVTSIDITPYAPGSGTNGVAIGNTMYVLESYVVTNSVTTTLSFPNGLVFPAGETLIAVNAPNSSGAVFVTVRGYLTSN